MDTERPQNAHSADGLASKHDTDVEGDLNENRFGTSDAFVALCSQPCQVQGLQL